MSSEGGAMPVLDDHAAGLREWVARAAGGEVVRAERHAGGSHRIAWQVDVAAGGVSPSRLFLTLDAPDAGGEDGNVRDGAVLSALGATSIPVPTVVARSGPGGALLMEWVDGASDAPAGADLEPVMADLMRQLAALHRFEPGTLAIPELPVPTTPEGLALDQLRAVEASYRANPAAHHPVVDFGLGWLRRNVPPAPVRPSLVHGDVGPGNMIYGGGRVRAIVDWEIAHWGDPMEDLAALAVRDMATPVGSYATRLREYEVASGTGVDAQRLRYYRVLVLVRNSLLICLTLAQSMASAIPPQLEAFALLLRRAATQALEEASGLVSAEWAPAAAGAHVGLPDRPLDDDDAWIPALAALSEAACADARETMGPLAEARLQSVPVA